MIDTKNVETADGDTSQEGRKLAVDEFLSSKPTRSFIEKVNAAHDNGVVDPLQSVENEDESSSEISEKE